MSHTINHHALTAIAPIDGRYASKTSVLSEYFSEAALIKHRIEVEVRYFLALREVLPQLKERVSEADAKKIATIADSFSLEEATKVKQIESTTNHDVKAVEYYIKERLDTMGIGREREFVHFALTSQDINNTAFPLMLKRALENVYLPTLDALLLKLETLATSWHDVPMLAHTHGQPASPTHLGKELNVFVYRLREQRKQLLAVPHSGKFGGATGNFNAHVAAFPEVDWKRFGDNFLRSLGLEREQVTTQIANYDNLAALFQAFARINTILVDLARDIWSYISMGYFGQKIKANEVGSSAMPHKVNPIDFENAEGNLLLANAVFQFLAQKLPISRLQRDLTDSTVLRNEGLPLAYTQVALQSLAKGLDKLVLNREVVERDLEANFEVVAEAIQTILRREGYPNPYEALKAFTRTGKAIKKETMEEFVKSLDISPEVKEELLAISPFTYTGY